MLWTTTLPGTYRARRGRDGGADPRPTSGSTDVVQVLEAADLPGGPDVGFLVVTVGAPDERRVDARVLGGRDVRFVIADEQRRVGIEIDQRPL